MFEIIDLIDTGVICADSEKEATKIAKRLVDFYGQHQIDCYPRKENNSYFIELVKGGFHI